MATRNGHPPSGDVGMDSLVIQAAHAERRFTPGTETVRLAASLVRHPQVVGRRAASLGRDLAGVVAGSSDRAPARGDRRFSDAAWKDNWLFRRLMQGYLAIGDAAHELIDEAHLDHDSDHRLHFIADNLLDAVAPTNFPLTNPTALKTAIDRGGGNFATGARAFVRDMRSPARLPANVDRTPFKLGENLANSAGAVVQREEAFELLQYTPTSDEVREVPLVIVPPMISKYYVVDLSPGRSLVEYLVGRGQQVFAISWRNPTAKEAGWNLDHYVTQMLDAFATAREITGADKVHVMGLCAGGVATSAAIGHLAAAGRIDEIAGITLSVTTVDTRRAGTLGSFVSKESAAAAVANVSRKGYLDRNQLLRTFAWLRPNDMVWNYWVSNYLLGQSPPAFDLLYWNSDTMDMPAGLHRDLVHIGVDNPLTRPDDLRVLGTPVDLHRVTSDAYIVAGETDHITPWPSCFKTTGLLGSDARFVLSNGGHIAAVINPPGNTKSVYRVAVTEEDESSDAWLERTEPTQGTWWEDWDAWLAERTGEVRPAPSRLGNRRHKRVAEAPGSYVFG